MYSVTKCERIKNKCIRRSLGITNVVGKMKKNRLKQFRHVREKMSNDEPVSRRQVVDSSSSRRMPFDFFKPIVISIDCSSFRPHRLTSKDRSLSQPARTPKDVKLLQPKPTTMITFVNIRFYGAHTGFTQTINRIHTICGRIVVVGRKTNMFKEIQITYYICPKHTYKYIIEHVLCTMK